jgi:uncharacterized protein (DUF58 family)
MSRARELALTGALLCASGALLGVPALLMPGLGALMAGVVSRGWVRLSGRGATVGMSCEQMTVQEGERIAFAVSVARGSVPFPGGSLLPWPGAEQLALPRGRSSRIAVAAFVSRRGRQSVGPALLRIADPLGISVCELACEPAEVLVLPKLYPLGPSALAFIDGAGRSARETAQELDSLRAHRPGSPASRIHWPTVARSGVLMEHSMQASEDPRVLVELDAEGPESEEALDCALRATASICHHFARGAGCLLLLPADRRPRRVRPDLRAWPALHAELAVLTPRASARRDPSRRPAGSLVRISASGRPAPAAAGAHVQVSPRPVGGVPVAFEVAGCYAQLVDPRRSARAA